VEIERGESDAPRRGPDRPDRPDRPERPEPTVPENRRIEDNDSDSRAGAGAVLTDPERLAAEHQTYRASVGRDYGAARDQWAEAVPELRAGWEKIKEKYGYEEREEPTPPPEGGAWLGKGGRRLDAAQNEAIDRGYARIREVAERTIIPGVLSVEAEDPSRRLAGFGNRFKGEDRLKEKIADRIRSKGQTPEEALVRIPDVVRLTYEYSETTYTAGVQQDSQRLGARGFTQLERRNTWDDDQYKGINSRWREPQSGVMFEVQFHTHASLEAKELTHKAYERIRSITDQTPEADRETAELKEFQRRVNCMIPIPPEVADIDDYPPGGK
jgi:hypothetical protein